MHSRQPDSSEASTAQPAFLAYRPPQPLAEIWQDPITYSVAPLPWFCKAVAMDFPSIKTPLPNYGCGGKGMIVKGILVSELLALSSAKKIGPNPEGMKKF